MAQVTCGAHPREIGHVRPLSCAEVERALVDALQDLARVVVRALRERRVPARTWQPRALKATQMCTRILTTVP